MYEHFKAIKVTDKVYWVGAIDWMIRDFHGYSTNKGTTFNAFLILADKITLVDTVKADHKEEFLSRINSIIDVKDIDYIISNHSEMDHSGLLTDMIALAKPQKVFTSTMGVKALSKHFHEINQLLIPLKDGEEIDLGNMTIKTYETRMLHWPDSMISYLKEEKILFSNDIFGMHLASQKIFDDENNETLLEQEAAKYFANIFMPFCPFVSKAMQKIESENLDIKFIATDHGPIWRTNVDKILNLYKKWPKQKSTKKAVIIYDTMWGSTTKMATAIGEGLSQKNIETKIMPIGGSHRSDIATELLDAGALIIGSPVLNNNIYPRMADVTTYLKGLKPKNLIGAAFGSYGWSDASLDQLKHILKTDLNVDMIADVLKVNYVPDKDDLNKCYELGIEIANKLQEDL